MSSTIDPNTSLHLMSSEELHKHCQRNKVRCPECGRLSFNPYALPLNEGGEPIDIERCGKCDHDSSCGYHMPPREYFALYPEKRPGAHLTKEEKKAAWMKRRAELEHERIAIARQRLIDSMEGRTEEAKQPDTIPADIVAMYEGRHEQSGLFKFLCTKYDRSAVERVFKMYRVTSDKKGNTLFWQIDQEGRCRSGKIIPYLPNGHRDKKDGSFAVNWVHSILKKQGALADGWQLQQCMFGEHLLTKDDLPQDVMIVESEKSAIICALDMPEYLWLSVGSLQNFKEEMLKPLRGWGTITAWPDVGYFDKWKAAADKMHGLDLIVSDTLEEEATAAAREKGLDIADYILDEF